MIATFAAHELCSELSHRKSNLGQIFRRVFHLFTALLTNRANEPLRDKRFHNRSEQEWFDIHVEQACYPADCVIRVQRAENEVARHGCANRDVRRFHVANLAHHHDVRILPQNVAQAAGKREINFRFHVHLQNAR